MGASPGLVVGIDSSTQSTKAVARRVDDGEVVASGSAPHPATTPPVSEQDPTSWWSALAAAVAQLGDHRRDVVAISVAGQQHGLVLLDAAGDPVRPAKLWNDTTSAPNADSLTGAIGAEQWARETGSVPVASFTITKLAWVAEHEPELLDRVAHVALPHDYLTWRLCGEHVTDRGDASGTGWYDPVGGRYLSELLDLAGVDGDAWLTRLPTVLGANVASGTILSSVADELGLPADVIVGPGTGDNMGAALGIGLRTADVAISLGTSGTVFAASPTPTHDARGDVAGFASATGDYLPLVCTLNATKVTDRMATWLGVDAAGLAALALDAPDSGGLTMLPYFDGERTPNLPNATGSLVGLTNSTTREHLALAAHDGVLCGLLDGLDALCAVGATTGGRTFLVGGGARSSAYRQRCADLSGSPVVVADAFEAVATGAAVQAAVVIGSEAIASVVERWGLDRGTTVDPRPDHVAEAAEVRARRPSG